MKKFKQGRHVPAFVLLFLAEGPSYGLNLQKKIVELVPYTSIDSAGIYRALKSLEDEQLVRSEWDTSNAGPAKKYYYITEQGIKELSEFKKYIETKIANLNFFLGKYQELKSQGLDLHE